jgi:hypothetical protein
VESLDSPLAAAPRIIFLLPRLRDAVARPVLPAWPVRSTTNAMYVVVNIERQVIDDDMLHVGIIQAASRRSGCDHDGGMASAEGSKSGPTLRTITGAP